MPIAKKSVRYLFGQHWKNMVGHKVKLLLQCLFFVSETILNISACSTEAKSNVAYDLPEKFYERFKVLMYALLLSNKSNINPYFWSELLEVTGFSVYRLTYHISSPLPKQPLFTNWYASMTKITKTNFKHPFSKTQTTSHVQEEASTWNKTKITQENMTQITLYSYQLSESAYVKMRKPTHEASAADTRSPHAAGKTQGDAMYVSTYFLFFSFSPTALSFVWYADYLSSSLLVLQKNHRAGTILFVSQARTKCYYPFSFTTY